MNNFDQLIKEKIEQHQHPYRESYWKAFLKSAGWSAGISGASIAIVSVVTAVIIGGGIFLATNPSSETPQTDPIINDSTILYIEEDILLIEDDTLYIVEEKDVAPAPAPSIARPKTQGPATPPEVKDTTIRKTVHPQKPKDDDGILRGPIIPSEIRTDTIKENY